MTLATYRLLPSSTAKPSLSFADEGSYQRVCWSRGSVHLKRNDPVEKAMSNRQIETLSAGSGHERILHLAVLTTLGVDLPKTAKILDFGCGGGNNLRTLHKLGYVNAEGYDVMGYRGGSGDDRDHITRRDVAESKVAL